MKHPKSMKTKRYPLYIIEKFFTPGDLGFDECEELEEFEGESGYWAPIKDEKGNAFESRSKKDIALMAETIDKLGFGERIRVVKHTKTKEVIWI
jgi:hypothetical protein